MSNLENKVNDIAKAIQDFSQNQFATKTDLNRAFNELISSLNTISDASNEKFSTQFLEHIRYLADERNKYLQDNLQAFETSMKELADNVDSKNFSYEVKRFSKELEDVRNKIEEQEHIFVNLSRLVEDLSNKSDTRASFEEIKDNLDDLSKGFEGVTSILNKKFSNFVSEVKKINNDQAFIDINLRLDGVLKTSNMIISAIDVIDEKYQNIKSVIEFVTNKSRHNQRRFNCSWR